MQDGSSTTSVSYASKECPTGHYCSAAAEYPTRCDAGRYTSQAGASTSDACVSCPAGFYCLAKDNVARTCPKGHWCAAGAEEPSPCYRFSHNSFKGQTTSSACHDCPPGYHCPASGTGELKSQLCPYGHYCRWNSTQSPDACPAGTYLNWAGATRPEDCRDCPAGYYCPVASVQPQPCESGTYCPEKTAAARTCPAGSYCPALSAAPLQSPAAFFQNQAGSDLYVRCPKGTYCGTATISPAECPDGYVGFDDHDNVDRERGCRPCDPGAYVPAGGPPEQRTCQACPPGFSCPGAGAAGRARRDRARQLLPAEARILGETPGYACPRGYFCPQGTSSEVACPRGTHQPSVAQVSVTACRACAAGDFGDDVGLTECRTCQGSSNSEAGSSTCQCLALNRVYLRALGACVCKSGYVPSDGSAPDIDSDVDCQKMVFARCETGQELDSNGACKGPTDCAAECDGAYGAVEAGLGVCRCGDAATAKEVCDEQCRSQLARVTFSAIEEISVTNTTTEEVITFRQAAVPGLAGRARCQAPGDGGCEIFTLGKDARNGDFIADFQLPDALGLKRRQLHSRRFLQGRRGLQAGQDLVIRNPVVCAGLGSAVLFQGLSSDHYPVYQKNSLLNSNDAFDFGAFVALGARLDSGDRSITSFLFAFDEPGIYVFRDSGNAAKEAVVAVMQAGGACPQSLMFEAKTAAALLQVGASRRSDVALTPDWTMFLAACIGFVVVVFLSVLTVSYIYNKNWDQDPARKAVQYQVKQYSKLRRSDIEDTKALVSINSDASSFQFRLQGQADSLMAVQAGVAPGAARSGPQEARTLDIDQLERLKEGLDQQVKDFKQLYTVGECLELSEEESDKAEEEPKEEVDLPVKITRLRELIQSHAAMHHAKEVVAAREAVDTRNVGEAEANPPAAGEAAPPEEPPRPEPLVLENNNPNAEPPDGDAEHPEPNDEAPLLDMGEGLDVEEAGRPAEEGKEELPPALEPEEGGD